MGTLHRQVCVIQPIMADEKLVDGQDPTDKVGRISAGMSALHKEMHKAGRYMPYVRLYSDDGQEDIESRSVL